MSDTFKNLLNNNDLKEKNNIAKLCEFFKEIIDEHPLLAINSLLFLINNRPKQNGLGLNIMNLLRTQA